MISQKQAIIGDLLINYYSSEKDSSPAVVFLHGWRSEGKIWLGIMEKIVQQNFSVFSFDFPGFGTSQNPPHDFNLADYAQITKDFIKQKVSASKIILVGHSFGGRVAIKILSSQSDLADKLVLVNSAGPKIKTQKKFIKIIAKILKPIFKIPGLRSLRFFIYKALGAEDYLATPHLKKTFLNIINEDLTPLLSQIKTTTLIIWGDRDLTTPLSISQILNKNIPHSDVKIIKDAGHFSFLDQPDEFVVHLLSFFKN